MIYFDNHATTRCDPRVVEAMLPWLNEEYGNPHSSSHELGRRAADAVAASLQEIAGEIGAPHESIVVTSGATESNNLAIRGVCEHPRQKRRHIVTVTTEHPAVYDVVEELERDGFRVTRVPVAPADAPDAGLVCLDALAAAVDDDTALVSVMWASNEIGAIAPISQIAEIAHAKGALLHSDATQAVGRLSVDTRGADVDLLSASAHKFYGPKGVGFLVVGNGNRRVRLKPQITGGGQQRNRRSGTMNPAGIVAMATALRLCREEADDERTRIARQRDRLWENLAAAIEPLLLNGPALGRPDRLAGNLNLVLPGIEGEAWMSATPEVAFSSGSACSSVEDTPSPVIRALGRSESETRRSVRFGLGRFTTDAEIEQASELLIASYRRLSG